MKASPFWKKIAMPNVDCIHCNNADVRKVSAIYQEETWTTTTSGTRFRVGRDRRGRPYPTHEPYTEHTSGMSRLAEMLKPPARPDNAWLVIAALIFFGLLAGLWWTTASMLHGNLLGNILG